MISIFVLAMLIALSGCVGTVEKSSSTMTDSSVPIANIINFSGVTRVVPISDSRLEVFFRRASGGSGKYVYEFYIGEQPVRYVPSDAFDIADNELKYTVTNLDLATTYSVRVEVRDARVNDPRIAPRSNNQKYLTARTFSNEVCDFNGISSIENMPGEDGRNSLRIRWIPATIITPQTANRAPLSYEIVLLKDGIASGKDQGTGIQLVNAQFDDQTLLPINGRYAYTVNFTPGLNETIVGGLGPDYNYKVRVRCLHRASIPDTFDSALRGEQNSNILRWYTLSDEAPTYEPRQIQYELRSGFDGYSGMRITWGPVIGAFSHFRTYLTTGIFDEKMIGPVCSREGEVICEKTNYDQNEVIITGLTEKRVYKVVLMICMTNDCSRRVKAKEGTVTTQPPAAKVYPLQGFELYTDPQNVGAIKFEVIPPDLKTGYLDNYIIQYRKGTSADRQWFDSSNQFTIDPYDIENDTSLTLRGLTFGALDDIYEFKILGQLNGLTYSPSTEVAPVIVNLKAEAGSLFAGPNKSNFKGISSVLAKDNGMIEVKWEVPKPASGFYTHYDFYLSNCASCNPMDTESNSFIYSFNREAVEATCLIKDSQTKECSQFLSVSQDERIRLSLSTSFISPLAPLGRLPTVINTCYWECQKGTVGFSCNLAGSCQ